MGTPEDQPRASLSYCPGKAAKGKSVLAFVVGFCGLPVLQARISSGELHLSAHVSGFGACFPPFFFKSPWFSERYGWEKDGSVCVPWGAAGEVEVMAQSRRWHKVGGDT